MKRFVADQVRWPVRTPRQRNQFGSPAAPNASATGRIMALASSAVLRLRQACKAISTCLRGDFPEPLAPIGMKSGYISLLPTIPAPPSLRLVTGTRAGICNRRTGLPELSWPKNTIPAARNAWRTASSFSGEGRRPPRSNSRISASLKSHLAPRLTRDQFNRARAAVTCSGVRGATKHLHCFLILP